MTSPTTPVIHPGQADSVPQRKPLGGTRDQNLTRNPTLSTTAFAAPFTTRFRRTCDENLVRCRLERRHVLSAASDGAANTPMRFPGTLQRVLRDPPDDSR